MRDGHIITIQIHLRSFPPMQRKKVFKYSSFAALFAISFSERVPISTSAMSLPSIESDSRL
jgi:hypothetical protein